MLDERQNRQFMQRAIEAGRHAMDLNYGGPFGAVVVNKKGILVAEGWNRVLEDNDPTAHAEVVAIRNAARHRHSPRLDDCTLYSSCEPYPLGLGAAICARIKKIVYAADHEDAAAIGFDEREIYKMLKFKGTSENLMMVQFMQAEARAMMEKWLRKGNRQHY